MLRLIGLVVSIGLADSMNPSTIAPALYLASGEKALSSLIQFTAAVFGVYFVGGLILVFGPGEAILSIVPHPGHTARFIAETVAGAVMLVAAGVLARNRRSLSRRNLPSPPSEGRSSLLMGLSITAVELPTAFPYFAAITAIVSSGLSPVSHAVLLLIYNLCFVLPLLLVIGTVVIAGDRAEEVLETAREKLQRHWPAALAGLALVAGAFVVLLGVTGLLSGGHGRVGRVARKVHRVLHH